MSFMELCIFDETHVHFCGYLPETEARIRKNGYLLTVHRTNQLHGDNFETASVHWTKDTGGVAQFQPTKTAAFPESIFGIVCPIR